MSPDERKIVQAKSKERALRVKVDSAGRSHIAYTPEDSQQEKRILSDLRKGMNQYREGLIHGYHDFVKRYEPEKIDSIEKVVHIMGIAIAATVAGEVSTKKLAALAKGCAVQLKALEYLDISRKIREIEQYVLLSGNTSLVPVARDYEVHDNALMVRNRN